MPITLKRQHPPNNQVIAEFISFSLAIPVLYRRKLDIQLDCADSPIKFLHSITSTWTVAKTSYYRHKVILKNTSQKPITNVKLMLGNLQGPLWGLSPTAQKNTYELPQWHKVLQPGAECTFVYVQGGPQAKISILSYN